MKEFNMTEFEHNVLNQMRELKMRYKEPKHLIIDGYTLQYLKANASSDFSWMNADEGYTYIGLSIAVSTSTEHICKVTD